MNGPSNEFRQTIFGRLAELPLLQDGARVISADVESQVDRVLGEVDGALASAILESRVLADEESDLSEADASELLIVVDQWASMASYVVTWVYGPQSPLPRGLAGWAHCVTLFLRRMARRLVRPLNRAAKALGADSWSIGVQFPWGLAVSLNWPAT